MEKSKLPMKKVMIFFLVVICVFSLSSCHYHKTREGLEEYKNIRSHGYSYSDYSIDRILPVDFLNDYPYLEGEYHYDVQELSYFAFFTSHYVDRAFAWTTYDTEIYHQAKQAYFETCDSENADLDGRQAFGFTFYIQHEFGELERQRFPLYFRAFGYNDNECKLIFIGFKVIDTRESPDEINNVEAAKTDLEGFLKNYFGEWYDWEA